MALLPGSSLGGDLDSSLRLTTSYPARPESSHSFPSQSHCAPPQGHCSGLCLTLHLHLGPPSPSPRFWMESSYISSPASAYLPPASTSCPKCCEGFPLLSGCPETGHAGDAGSIPGSGSSLGEGNGYPLQCSSLENPMDRGVWWAIVPGVTKSRTRLSD